VKERAPARDQRRTDMIAKLCANYIYNIKRRTPEGERSRTPTPAQDESRTSA